MLFLFFNIYSPPRKDHPVHASDLQKIIDLMEKHELGKPAILGSFGNGPSSSSVGVAGGSGSCPSSASSGVVDAECRQEVEAAHPAPAWGRWTPANPGLVAVMSWQFLSLL